MLKTSPSFSKIRTPSSYPGAQKHYLCGSHSDLRVPYREIALSATRHMDCTEENRPLPVYDTSGPFTDPEIKISVTQALKTPRGGWIRRRDDTDILRSPSSEYARQREN